MKYEEVEEKQLFAEMLRELVLIRKQNTEFIAFMRDAEKEIPEFMRRFANYMHDLHHIKYCYEELGHAVPAHVLRELERCDDRYRQLVVSLHTDGGAFEKVRREMAKDPDNRWDHTRLLFKPKETEDETGKVE